jgi:hypothetical protein
MVRRRTPAEARYPSTPEFGALATAWATDANLHLLELVWAGYDTLRAQILEAIDCKLADRDLERCITQLLEPQIRKKMDPDAPFYLQHGPYEEETALPPPAQPPQYDLAFVIYDNPRVMWPMEAKILRTDRAVATYVRDVREEFLTCRYSPFSSEAAMLGYLVEGQPDAAFGSIEASLHSELHTHTRFSGRNHRFSDHDRLVPPEKAYPRQFRCHHLILRLS